MSTEYHACVHSRQYKLQRQIVFCAGINPMQRQHALDSRAARAEIQVQCFNWLVTVDDVDLSFLDDSAESRNETEINRQSSIQANEICPRVAKFLLQVSASSGHESQVQTVCFRVSAEVKLHGLSTATVQRIQNVQDFDQGQ